MKKIAIIGAGISGLFIANLLKKNSNYEIAIYEKNTSVTLEEGYGVQLSVNSIRILNEIGFRKFENNEKFTPEKINFYSNDNSYKISSLQPTITKPTLYFGGTIGFNKASCFTKCPHFLIKLRVDL